MHPTVINSRRRRAIAGLALGLGLWLVAAAASAEPRDAINPDTQRFDTGKPIRPDEVNLFVGPDPIDLSQMRRFVVVEFGEAMDREMRERALDLLKQYGQFETIYTIEEFARKVLKDALAAPLIGTHDPHDSTLAESIYGPFLIVTVDIGFVDPNNPTTLALGYEQPLHGYALISVGSHLRKKNVLYVIRSGTSDAASLGDVAIYPVFNFFADWVEKNS